MEAAKSNQMSDIEKIRFVRNEYHKKWRLKNPDKARRIQDRYWLKRFQELQSHGAESVQIN